MQYNPSLVDCKNGCILETVVELLLNRVCRLAILYMRELPSIDRDVTTPSQSTLLNGRLVRYCCCSEHNSTIPFLRKTNATKRPITELVAFETGWVESDLFAPRATTQPAFAAGDPTLLLP